jgi:sterol 3beta-glucosyltransferase
MYRDLEYATTLTRQRAAFSSTPYTAAADEQQKQPSPSGEEPDDMEGEEESWTFVDDYADAKQNSFQKTTSAPAK